MSKYEREFRKQRLKAIERDEGFCVLCGGMASDVHHIIFRSAGGTNNLDNLVCLCRSCHQQAHGHKSKQARAILLQIIKGGE